MDYTEFEKIIRGMKPRSVPFEIVKSEMLKRGRWKNKPRGQVFKKGFDSRRKGDNS